MMHKTHTHTHTGESATPTAPICIHHARRPSRAPAKGTAHKVAMKKAQSTRLYFGPLLFVLTMMGLLCVGETHLLHPRSQPHSHSGQRAPSLRLHAPSSPSASTIVLDRRAFASGLIGGLAAAAFTPFPAQARAAGAAELDAKFYLKSLFTGNKVVVDRPPPPPAPSRGIDGALARRIQQHVFDALLEARSRGQEGTGGTRAELEAKYASLVAANEPLLRDRWGALPGPVAEEADTLGSSRALNLAAYCWWKLALENLPTPADRAAFARLLGDNICADVLPAARAGSATGNGSAAAAAAAKVPGAGDLSAVIEDAETLLTALRTAGLLKGYTMEVAEDGQEDWDSGYTVDMKLSLFESATLPASLQLAAENERLRPDLAGLAMGALFRRRGVATRFDEYFLDETYREDPNDIRPTLLLQQWSLDPVKK